MPSLSYNRETKSMKVSFDRHQELIKDLESLRIPFCSMRYEAFAVILMLRHIDFSIDNDNAIICVFGKKFDFGTSKALPTDEIAEELRSVYDDEDGEESEEEVM